MTAALFLVTPLRVQGLGFRDTHEPPSRPRPQVQCISWSISRQIHAPGFLLDSSNMYIEPVPANQVHEVSGVGLEWRGVFV